MKITSLAVAALFFAAALVHAGDDGGEWVAFGTVTDAGGRGVEGAAVRANCGWGTLMPTGNAVTDSGGNYRIAFRPGMRIEGGVGVQYAVISVSKDGYFEKNLCRQGDLLMASSMPGPEERFKSDPARIVLPGQPRRIDFTLLRAASVEVILADEDDKPVSGVKIWIDGDDMPPASGVLSESGPSDAGGRILVPLVPVGFRWRFNISDDLYSELTFASHGRHAVRLRRAVDPDGGFRILHAAFQSWPEGAPRPADQAVSDPPWVGRSDVWCRMRAERIRWAQGDEPVLVAELWNRSGMEVRVPEDQRGWSLEADGRSCSWKGSAGAPFAPLPAGSRSHPVRISLGSSWEGPGGKPLDLAPGKHEIRICAACRHSTGSMGAFSNRVTIEIASSTGAGWSRPDKVKEVYMKAVDAWAAAYKASKPEKRGNVDFQEYLESESRRAGAGGWADFSAKAAASMGPEAWTKAVSELSALMVDRLKRLAEEIQKEAQGGSEGR